MGEKLKSALEIAMEKYGVSADSQKDLSEEQKQQIAEIRNFYKAKKAEIKILYEQDLKQLQQSAAEDILTLKDKREKEYLQDRAKLEAEEERKVQHIRRKD
ncbi:hypothetical protein ACFL27_24865 [candidate division CSSED10-310 bacterium]|uniref:Uncharacterized protein n=1 Tax=candidate division CSSED10-310 bacterium TaxID=2855610 RepID=A0ABV6Z4T8_UNCC1